MRIISGSRAALHHEVTCKRRSPRYRAPRGLRELGLLIRDRPDGPTVKEAASPMVRYAAQMHADVSFLRRELRTLDSIPPQVMQRLREFAQAFQATVGEISAVARGRGTGAPGTQALRHACGDAIAGLREACPNSEGARLMLRRLVEDSIGVAAAIAGARQNVPGMTSG